MSFALGIPEENRNTKPAKERKEPLKQISVYDGGRAILTVYGRISYSDQSAVRIIAKDGTETTVFNAVVIVTEKSRNKEE